MTQAWIVYLSAFVLFCCAVFLVTRARIYWKEGEAAYANSSKMWDDVKAVQIADLKMLQDTIQALQRAKEQQKGLRPDDENFIKFLEKTKPEDLN